MDFGAFRHKVGANLKRARWAAGMTQEEAASQSGVEFRHYQRLERGDVDPHLSTVFALATVFRVPPAALVEFASAALTAGARERMDAAVPPKVGRRLGKKR